MLIAIHYLAELFRDDLKTYPKTQLAAEFLARIPQALFTLAVHNRDKKEQWNMSLALQKQILDEAMSKALPNLWPFFKTQFLAKCKDFIGAE